MKGFPEIMDVEMLGEGVDNGIFMHSPKIPENKFH